MNGRKLFAITKPFYSGIYYLTLILPSVIYKWLWPLLDLFPGYLGVGLRYIFIKRLLKNVGDNVYVARNVTIKHWDRIIVGSNVSIHECCYLDGAGGLTLGDNVSVAHHSSFITFEHTWEDSSLPIKYNPTVEKSIRVCNDVWIGCGVRVLAGSVVNERCIVAAGAVLKGDIPAKSIFGGVPAKKIGESV